jgi:hypothetical protein
MIGASLIAPPDLEFLAALAATCPRGEFVEIGVYRGGSAARLYDVASRQGRTLHLYDTFAGHPVVDAERDNLHQHPQGRYGTDAITPAELRAALPNAVIHVGTFPDTLVNMDCVAFAHVDCDLYWPTLAACRRLPAQMPVGGVLYFDDYSRVADCPGVRAAVEHVFGEGPALPNGNRIVVIEERHRRQSAQYEA